MYNVLLYKVHVMFGRMFSKLNSGMLATIQSFVFPPAVYM
jgi:hypothetical protein